MATISLYWEGLPDDVSACLQQLLDQPDSATLVAVSQLEADICIYGAGIERQPAPTALLIVEQQHPGDIDQQADFLLPPGFSPGYLQHVLKQACCQLELCHQNRLFLQQMQHEQQQLKRLTDIGLALSAEHDHQTLLQRILTEARRLGQCDAASIFLVDESADETQLVFKLTQNDSLAIDFQEQHFPLDNTSLAGHSVLSGDILNIEDVYQLADGDALCFNKEFDQQTGYRTRSMLVIPMRTHDDRIVGVIQFINRKKQARPLRDADDTERMTLAFDAPLQALLQAMTSQAAVAIENNSLIERINQLFEGFVSASVRAIEQRDPTTSGHSFRVAELTTALAEGATQQQQGRLQRVNFTTAELKELRYAALLHDFGKVGVREHVLVKAKKLTPMEYLRFQYRLALQQEAINKRFLERQLALARQHKLSSAAEEQLQQEQRQALQQLDVIRQAVEQANEPSVLAADTFEHLQALKETVFPDLNGQQTPLLQEQEFLALAVKKGSLTEHERSEIESHVTHTIHFLQTIPWTPELAAIPAIAGAHHEKLDGSGYPRQLLAQDIPVGAKMMTICDIFDALTATDRPYKPALPVSRALDILGFEAKDGKIDPHLYQLFCQLPHHTILPSLKSL